MLDDELLDRLQRAAFGYFTEETNPVNGLVADTSRKDSPASIAVVGFALSAYPVAVERGWLTREDAAARTLVTLALRLGTRRLRVVAFFFAIFAVVFASPFAARQGGVLGFGAPLGSARCPG
jgi:hypothetical protein